MASFAELLDNYGPSPLSWSQYAPTLAGDDLRTETGLQVGRGLRDLTRYDIPDLVSQFAARGTFHSGRRERDVNRLATRGVESLGDAARKAGTTLQDLATSQVGATIGGTF